MSKANDPENALKLAERVLDRPFADPDDDQAVLARQLIRKSEALTILKTRLEAAEAVCRLADVHYCGAWKGAIGEALEAWHNACKATQA